MPLPTSLHDVQPFELKGLYWLGLSETGYVLRPTIADNLGGGGTYTFGTVGTYACRVDPSGGAEDLRAGRIEEGTSHAITLPPWASVTAKDRFKVAGGTYEIRQVSSRTNQNVLTLQANRQS